MKNIIIYIVIFITIIIHTELQSREINLSDLPKLNLKPSKKEISIREKYNIKSICQKKDPLLDNSQIYLGVGFLPGEKDLINFKIEFVRDINFHFSILAGLDGYIPDQVTFNIMPFYNLKILKNILALSIGGGIQIGGQIGVFPILSVRVSTNNKIFILGLEVKKPFLFKKNYPETPFINFNLGFFL